jgi:hypothetical protein
LKSRVRGRGVGEIALERDGFSFIRAPAWTSLASFGASESRQDEEDEKRARAEGIACIVLRIQDAKMEILVKAEALPLKDQVSGYRILYSHNCQFGLSQMHDTDKTSMECFPALRRLRSHPMSTSHW